MTVPTQESQVQEQKPSDKEFNFRALENKYKSQLDQERAARIDAEERLKRSSTVEDDDDEPYVDRRRLDKKLAQFGQETKKQTQDDVQYAVKTAIAEERKSNWLKQNGDFYDVLKHAEKFAQKDPELAESILEMPEGFERQKLVYKNIKALGLHLPEQKQPSVQDKIDANRRSPGYQPSGVSSSPYAQQADFSKSGQKQAYDKMQELKSRLRI